MEHVIVVGSGVAGMACARLLSQRFRVTLVEREQRVGGHVNTVLVDDDGQDVAVDTGFIVYNERNYPHFTAMLDFLRVASQPSDMSFSVSVDEGAFEFAGSNLLTLFCQPTNLLRPAFLRLLRDIARFNAAARALLDAPGGEQRTLGAFLDAHRLGALFRNRYLLPMAGAIWSCPTAEMLNFPALALARFYHNHGLLDLGGRPQWRTVVGGSRVYADALLAPLGAAVRLASAVASVRRDADAVRLRLTDGHELSADRVVFATHADQTLTLLEAPSSAEQRLLGAFRYQPNQAVLHTDVALMPRRRLAWSAWNYLAASATDGHDRVSVSYWMNRLQGLATARTYVVSLNPIRAPREETVLAEFDYEHPVFSPQAMAAQPRLDDLQGQSRSWFCGAWCGYGFHEDGLRSAVRVAEHMGVPVPWAGRLSAATSSVAPPPAPPLPAAARS